jgi:hypothetical protein
MGNNNPRPIRFRQSPLDFPCVVDLDRKVPAWGLSRWHNAGPSIGGLRFVPDGEESYTLRGDNRQLLYRGRKRSHRLTILGDDRFEYDCILHKPPDSNTVALRLDGADNFDFFRQPEFIKNPLLAGSYAVYRKETYPGQGTGKLCHIHRPQIIDAGGRKVWGDLSVDGDRLCITIPESWLADAKYPVVVDPVVGTSTIGSQTHATNSDGDSMRVFIEFTIAVNKFLIPQTLNGMATAYVYAYYSGEYEGPVKPVLYTDSNDIPQARRSAAEGTFDIEVYLQKPASWRSTTFMTNSSIASGTYVWFGIISLYFAVRFDFGAKCYLTEPDSMDVIPDIYPKWYGTYYYNQLKPSMYFDYTSAQNYVRTLTQGVSLIDSRKLIGSFNRNIAVQGRGITALGHTAAYHREHTENVKATDWFSWVRVLYHTITDAVGSFDLLNSLRNLARDILQIVRVSTVEKRSAGIRRDINGTAKIIDQGIVWIRGFFRNLLMNVKAGDTTINLVVRMRLLAEMVQATDGMKRVNNYIRGLYVMAGSLAETRHAASYYRKHADTAYIAAVPLRHLIIFMRLLTVGFVRDYLLHRFLKAREEITLKSHVCREIVLESRIH